MKRFVLLLLPFALGAFFILGGIVNGSASLETRQDFVAWGYPEWFPYVTAALELSAAAMLFIKKSRLIGAALGMAVMSAAAFTLVTHGELQHAIAPLVVLAASLTVGWTAYMDRELHRARPAASASNPWEGEGA